MKGAGVGDFLAPGQVHIGSVLDLAGRLEPQGVQTIVTSPPYWGLRSYLPADHPDKAHELGSEATPEAFVANLVAVFAALRPALKDDGTIWLNLGDSYNGGGGFAPNAPSNQQAGRPNAGRSREYSATSRRGQSATPPKSLLMIPHRVALALQADGWVIRQDVVWSKPNPMPESVTDRPTRAHEYLFLIAKGPRYFYDAEAIKEPAIFGRSSAGSASLYGRVREADHRDGRENPRGRHDGFDPGVGRNKRSVWDVPTAAFPDAHYATFAPDLIRPCVLAGTSAAGECSACGRAWVRVVEREGETPREKAKRVGEGGYTAAYQGDDGARQGLHHAGHRGEVRQTQTTGWAPQCACPPGTPTRPQVVCDPFAGSCTTWQVAHEEGRRFVGFDLDERAVEWGRQRLAKLPVGRLFA